MFSGKIKKIVCLFLFLALNPVSQSFGQDISVTATVDKSRLTLEDVLQLSIIIQGTQNTPPPELSSLPDFRVVSAGTSSSTQYINTQRSVSITYNYRLTPMNTGTFVIGPTRVRANGKTYATQPITIAVQNEAQKSSNQETTGNKNAFVVTTLSSKKAYVGKQLVYTFRLFHRVDAKNLNLRLPFDKTRFHKEELGEPKTYISSADWMTRNLDNRVEISCPIYQKDIQQELLDTFNICWSDNVKARDFSAIEENAYKTDDQAKVRSQFATYDYYLEKLASKE